MTSLIHGYSLIKVHILRSLIFSSLFTSKISIAQSMHIVFNSTSSKLSIMSKSTF